MKFLSIFLGLRETSAGLIWSMSLAQLTHNDVEQIKGDVELLAGKIEERYGVTKEVRNEV